MVRSLIILAGRNVYQTGSITSLLWKDSVPHVEAEYTGSNLEPVYDMKMMPSDHESGYQKIACVVRDGKIKLCILIKCLTSWLNFLDIVAKQLLNLL